MKIVQKLLKIARFVISTAIVPNAKILILLTITEIDVLQSSPIVKIKKPLSTNMIPLQIVSFVIHAKKDTILTQVIRFGTVINAPTNMETFALSATLQIVLNVKGAGFQIQKVSNVSKDLTIVLTKILLLSLSTLAWKLTVNMNADNVKKAISGAL